MMSKEAKVELMARILGHHSRSTSAVCDVYWVSHIMTM